MNISCIRTLPTSNQHSACCVELPAVPQRVKKRRALCRTSPSIFLSQLSTLQSAIGGSLGCALHNGTHGCERSEIGNAPQRHSALAPCALALGRLVPRSPPLARVVSYLPTGMPAHLLLWSLMTTPNMHAMHAMAIMTCLPSC